VGVPPRTEVKTTRERGADRENRGTTRRRKGRYGQPSRGVKRQGKRERAHRNKRKRGEHPDIRYTMLSSTRRRATLNTGRGPTTNVRVGKEAVKVSEMGGPGAGTGTEYEVRTMPTRLWLVLITSSKGQRRRKEDEDNREKNGYEGGKR
jgi:hypothetical protein